MTVHDTKTCRYALGIKTYTVRDTHDGHIAVNGEVIMNYSPEYQTFRSSKYSQPRDASGFIKPEPPISNGICGLSAQVETENISAALSRKRRGRAVHEHGQDPETGEVNPRLEAVINFPGYKAAVDLYFAHFSAQHQSNDDMYPESKL